MSMAIQKQEYSIWGPLWLPPLEYVSLCVGQDPSPTQWPFPQLFQLTDRVPCSRMTPGGAVESQMSQRLILKEWEAMNPGLRDGE